MTSENGPKSIGTFEKRAPGGQRPGIDERKKESGNTEEYLCCLITNLILPKPAILPQSQ